jgi:hypothetical protein
MDYGAKNTAQRAKWYTEVFNPLRRLVIDLGVDPGGIGSAAGWNGAALHRHNQMGGNAATRTYARRVKKNFEAAAAATGGSYSNSKWDTLNKAKNWIATMSDQAALTATMSQEEIDDLPYVDPYEYNPVTVTDEDEVIDEYDDEGNLILRDEDGNIIDTDAGWLDVVPGGLYTIGGVAGIIGLGVVGRKMNWF